MPLLKSWVASANDEGHPFPLNNLPCGVFTSKQRRFHCGVAIGDMILDVTACEESGLIKLAEEPLFNGPGWNRFMAAGPGIWAALRSQLTELLSENTTQAARIAPQLIPIEFSKLHMPFAVTEFTDFYAGRNHAFNVGSMFRDPQNALPPNWLHIPIGYNGRASSVVVSGTRVRRPWGQMKSPDHDLPAFLPSRRFDLELEMGAVVGTASDGPISVAEADAHIFGYVLLNDWSARDIQAWEYQPLGPFQAKAAATSISPWIVTAAALDPFRRDTPEREFELLDHLKDCGPMLYDIDLTVTLAPSGKPATTIARTNYKEMYYSAAQQLAHHATSGCPMSVGDLLGSGTISGPTKSERGSLLELSWGGKEPLTLETGETRSFIQDGDTVTIRGAAQGDGYSIGFGDCSGKIIAALGESRLPY